MASRNHTQVLKIQEKWKEKLIRSKQKLHGLLNLIWRVNLVNHFCNKLSFKFLTGFWILL